MLEFGNRLARLVAFGVLCAAFKSEHSIGWAAFCASGALSYALVLIKEEVKDALAP